ncbi:uncharacterized protein LOC116734298 [Xiphophorus hellerii]|uniref:uncharacterized protein LOC116734298 n=1 Tax=Xiphophorus hellerii TaxID=8084 RepID=UPI0013B44BAC|nr:uncharacterized protein LOC116734298 [Xiphophorus hellerii]
MISIFRSAAEKSLSVQRLIDGQEMLVLVLVVVLQFEGTRGGKIDLYHREGENVVLPSERPSSDYPCSIINWLYSRDGRTTNTEVGNGKVVQSSPRASRLNMDSSCSLIINNITADDAGLYTCRPGPGPSSDDRVLLNVLTISPSPTDADPAKEDFTLRCSLVRYGDLGSCPDKSLLWVDETGSELTGEGDEYKFGGQTGCVSLLTVNLQSSRRFTCQFIEGDKVKIEAHYGSEAAPAGYTSITIIIVGSVIVVLLLLVVLAAVFTKLRKTRNKEDHKTATDQDSTCGNHHYDELQSDLTYATVNLPETSQKTKDKRDKDTVAYSTVRTKEKTEAD